MTLAPGSRLGPYEILTPLGAGGMGVVYRARHIHLGREVAVKVLPEARGADALARFEREAKAVAALSHPNVLAIHDFGIEEGVPYAVTELLEGETLRSRLAGSALPWRKALEIGVAIAEGLAAAHAKEIVHRDLKPENIFLTADGQVRILDFGLARRGDRERTSPHPAAATGPILTDPGIVMGTVGYMSPEQVRGGGVEAPSDIFAFGCVLYEMLTGQRAFARDSAAETMTAVLREDPPEISASGRTIPVEVQRVLHHCLEKGPQERFQSARDLAFALKAISLGTGTAPMPATLPAARLRPALLTAVAGLVLLGIGVASLVLTRHEPPIDSLAVLPFANASNDPESEYLADGLTESLINSLSRLPRLRISPRTTVFRYKGRDADPQAVGRDLNVRAVLTGRVSQRGDTLNVQTDLVDVTKGSQLWGERYTRKLSDILAMEEEIARQISGELRLKLTGEERRQLARRSTQDTEAYQLYLKGRYHWNRRTGEGLMKGAEYFSRAIERDSGYALAYAGLADCYTLMSSYGVLAPEDGYPKAEAAARKALEVDDTLAEAHASLGNALQDHDWDWAGSERELTRAIELDPNYANARHWYALRLMATGRDAEAQAEIERAQGLDPLSPPIVSAEGWVHYAARRYDRTIELCQRTLEIDPRYFPARVLLALAYGQKGMHKEAIAQAEEARAVSGGSPLAVAGLGWTYAVAGRRREAQELLDGMKALSASGKAYVSPYWIAVIYTGLGDKERAFEWLEKARVQRSNWLLYLKVEPLFDSLRGDPRFSALLERIGLAS